MGILSSGEIARADLGSLQLMWADFKEAPQHHFYIKKIAELRDGSFMIPIKWICVVSNGDEIECADVHELEFDSEIRHLSSYQTFGCIDTRIDRKYNCQRCGNKADKSKRFA